jgi:hypothetical protein
MINSSDYNSIDQIKKDFEIYDDDLEILRNKINEVRVKFHPDRTNGSFLNESDKLTYYKANNAISFIDKLTNNRQLLVIETMTGLLKVVTQSINKPNIVNAEDKVESTVNFAIQTYRSPQFIPRISLAALTIVVTFLYAFPVSIKDNPFLSKYISPSNNVFVMLWFELLLTTIVLWSISYTNEERDKRRLSLLKVESIQNSFFKKFIKTTFIDKAESSGEFSKDDLYKFINKEVTSNDKEKLLSKLLSSQVINPEVLQSVTDLILIRAEKNGVISKSLKKSLTDKYTVYFDNI